MMRNCSRDFLTLVAVFNSSNRTSISSVVDLLMKRKGTLQIPPITMRQMLVARELHARFKAGDLRADDMELGHIKALGEWLVEKHAECFGRTPRQDAVKWDDNAMFAVQAQKPGKYREIYRRVAEGGLDG
jgi:hypothetical protein